MSIRVAINGFGRVRRSVVRAARTQSVRLEIVAVNDVAHSSRLVDVTARVMEPLPVAA